MFQLFSICYFIRFWLLEGDNDSKTLTVTNSAGDRAIYGNEILSANDVKDLQFAIYPNPASEQLTFTSKNANGTIEIQIFDVEGKLLSNQNFNGQNSYTLDVSNLSSGIYFLKLSDENGNVKVKKFIKKEV